MGLLSDTINKRTKSVPSDGKEGTTQSELEQLQPVQPAVEVPTGKNGASFSSGYDPTAYQKDWTIYDIIANTGKPYDYRAEIRQAERAKKMGIFTDILGLAGNLATGIAGRRIYNQAPQATSIAETRLQRLKDLQRAGGIQYQNALQNARLQDYQNARQDTQHKAALEAQANKLRADMAYKQAEFARKTAKDRDDSVRWRTEQAGKAADRDAINKYRNSLLSIRKEEVKQKSTNNSNEDYDYLIGHNGRQTAFPKSKANAVAGYLYARMKEIIEASPMDKRTLDDVTLTLGEGGDQSSKTLAIVKRKIKDFPELQDELDYILANSEIEAGNASHNVGNASKLDTKEIGWADEDNKGKLIGW